MTERIPENLFKDDHYQGRPADYDDLIIRRRVELVRQIPKFLNSEMTLLDVGCGNGASMFELHNSFKACQGIDIESKHKEVFEVEKYRRKIDNCSFSVLNLEEEDLAIAYDRVICFEVIEHFKEDKNVKKIYDSMNKGGLAAITVPNKWWIFETHGASGLPKVIPWNRVPFFSWLPTPLHERWANARIYTKKRIINLLTNTGFEILDSKYITAPLDVLGNGKAKEWFQRNLFKGDETNMPFLSTSIMVVVKK